LGILFWPSIKMYQNLARAHNALTNEPKTDFGFKRFSLFFVGWTREQSHGTYTDSNKYKHTLTYTYVCNSW